MEVSAPAKKFVDLTNRIASISSTLVAYFFLSWTGGYSGGIGEKKVLWQTEMWKEHKDCINFHRDLNCLISAAVADVENGENSR